MAIIVTTSSAFGLRSPRPKRRSCVCRQGGGEVSFTINAAGQVYKQTIEVVYLGGAITADRELCIKITRRIQRAWACLQR